MLSHNRFTQRLATFLHRPLTAKEEILCSIIEKSDGYMFLGGFLSKTETKDFFTMGIYDHDEQLKRAFSYAGNFSSEQLELIDRHTCTLYVIGEGGSIENANKILDAGSALLKAGGIAVKVESSGIAHSMESWKSMTQLKKVYQTFRAFVTFAGEEDFYYSCSMHWFGYPDVIVPRESSNPSDVASLMQAFLLYNLIEKPVLKIGETFSIDSKSPHYILEQVECTYFEKEHPFYNPYGVWKLRKK